MALRGKLRTYTLSGGTKAVKVWKGLELSENPTGAASRLMLVDTRGEIPSEILCNWLSEVESERRSWEQNKEKEVTNDA